MIRFFTDNIAFTLILAVVSVAHFMIIRKMKSINLLQAVFVSLLASPLILVEGLFGLVAVVGNMIYKFILLLGGVSLAEFDQEIESIENSLDDDEFGGDE